jgi:two-component system nitrogen regulation sensor histidine kinase NtrY
MRLMEEATQEYQTLEEGRTSLQLAFGILYLGFALIVLSVGDLDGDRSG